MKKFSIFLALLIIPVTMIQSAAREDREELLLKEEMNFKLELLNMSSTELNQLKKKLEQELRSAGQKLHRAAAKYQTEKANPAANPVDLTSLRNDMMELSQQEQLIKYKIGTVNEINLPIMSFANHISRLGQNYTFKPDAERLIKQKLVELEGLMKLTREK